MTIDNINFNEYGPIGLLLIGAYLAIKEIIPFLARLRNGSNGNGISDNEVKSKIKELHHWHEPDSEGRQRWRNSDMKELIIVIKEQTAEIRELRKEMGSTSNTLTTLVGHMDHMLDRVLNNK